MNTQVYLDKYFINAEDINHLASIREGIEVDAIMIQFHNWVAQQYPDFGEMLAEKEFIERVLKNSMAHWTGLFSGKIDDEFIQKRLDLGKRNAQNKVAFDVYFEGTAKMFELFQQHFQDKGITDKKILLAFERIFKLEIFIVSTAQSKEIEKTLQNQNDALRELSAPIARLQKDLLFVPLVGFIDSKRAQDIMNTILEKIAITQAKVFIVDIGGIAVMDTAVANYLIKITKATNLMGCQTILSGLSSTVAQTIVELGINVSELLTTGNLEDALNKGLAIANGRIIYD